MELQMDEDYLCINRFLNGEVEAFEILVRKYQDKGLNIVYSLIGRDKESEDIMQEVFLKVFRSLKSFKQQSKFSTWLYRIIVNTSYDFLRRRRNLVNDESLLEEYACPCAGPQEVLLRIERDRMIQRAIANVPLKFRSALVLKDIEGLSYIEISGILRCSIGTVESKIYRARQFLKKELASLEVDMV